MADNTTISLMSGGDVIATDEIAGAKYQRIKLIHGADGVNDGDVSTVNGLPVQFSGSLPAGTNAIGKSAANSGIDIGDVDVTSIVPGVGATNLGKAEDAAHTSGDTGVMALGVGNVAQSSFAADGDYIPLAVDLKGNLMIGGNIAHDGVDAGNPTLNGYRAIAHGANPTAVAAADRTVGFANRHGIPFVIGGHPNIITLRTNYTGAQTNAALVTVATGLKIVVTECSVLADNANTVNVQARVGFATATTPTGAGTVLSHPGIAPGSGVGRGNGSGMIGVGADDEDLRITSTVPTGGSIDVMVSYYTIES